MAGTRSSKTPLHAVPEPLDLAKPALRRKAVAAAQGRVPFDLLLRGGRVADVITGRLRRRDVGIVGSLIASVHSAAVRREARCVVDVEGAVVAPGLLDTHLHIESSMITPSAYAAAVVPRGITTVAWDPHELANTAGLQGMDYACRAATAAPLRILTLAPSCVPSAPGLESTGANFTPESIAKLLARPDIYGLGEVMSMQALLRGDRRMAKIVQAGLLSGKKVCGHARSLRGSTLQAYLAAGITSDHEVTSAADLMAKLEAGLAIELRGSHDHLLPEFVDALRGLGFMPGTVTLCTDDMFPDDLHAAGGLDDVMRRLIRYGLKPMHALQAATVNAAQRLGRPDLGVVAPGRRADLVLCQSLRNFKAATVIASGKKVAAAGALLVAPAQTRIPAALKNTIRVRRFSANDFRIRAAGLRATLATIEKPRFPVWGKCTTSVTDGYVDCPADKIMMAVVNRFSGRRTPKLALLGQWGSWRGVFATTVSHDSHNLTLFGSGAANMAVAANAVAALGGGVAVVADGKVRASLALPVVGLVSTESLAEVARQFQKVRAALDEIVTWQPPYLVFKACFGASLVCNPGPHLSDVGLVDSATGTVLSTAVLETFR